MRLDNPARQPRPAFRRSIAVLAAAAAVAATAALAAVPAVAATGDTAPSPAKAVPSAPAPAPNVHLGTDLPAKPKSPPRAARAADPVAWTVHLTASNASPWVTQYSTLTATTNADIGPTPYYLRIYRDGVIASCGSGTSCSVSVTESTPTMGSFGAYLTDGAGNVVASWCTGVCLGYFITWHATTVELGASPSTLAVGGVSTLTATTGDDVGPSPFYTEIFDETAGTLLRSCGTGTTCATTVSQSAATTHTYKAFVSPSSGTLPPPGAVASSVRSYVTWTANGWTITLNAPATEYEATSITATATASVNVGPTPYYLEIFNDDSGALLATCGTGTTCTVSVPLQYDRLHLVAFITTYGSTINPSAIQAASAVTVTVPVPRPPR